MIPSRDLKGIRAKIFQFLTLFHLIIMEQGGILTEYFEEAAPSPLVFKFIATDTNK